jgi:hypothetical protein
MDLYPQKLHGLHFLAFVLVLIVVFAAFSGLSERGSGTPSQQERGRAVEEPEGNLKVRAPKVTNKTRAFEVVNIEELDAKNIRLTLRNGYEKTITGFQVSVGVGRVQTDLMVSGDDAYFVLPGGTYQRIYAIQHETDTRGIAILAVIFADGTSDGDQEAIEEVEFYRLGMKTERKRVLNLLQDTLKLDDSELASALRRVEYQVSFPPLNQDKTLPYEKNRRMYNIYFGTRDERMRIVREIHNISQSHIQDASQVVSQSLSWRQHLVDLVGYYERMIRKL